MIIAQASRDLDIGQNLLQRWKKQFTTDPVHASPGKGYLNPADEELRQLRLDNARLRQVAPGERYFKKAVAIYSETVK